MVEQAGDLVRRRLLPIFDRDVADAHILFVDHDVQRNTGDFNRLVANPPDSKIVLPWIAKKGGFFFGENGVSPGAILTWVLKGAVAPPSIS
jgi:hypothetical protein